MRALIVTFVRAYNYGAVLQCYALSKTLKELGVDVEVLDYYPDYFRSQYQMTWMGKPQIMPSIHIRSWLKKWFVTLKLNRRNRGFEDFLEEYIPLTEEQYINFESVEAAKLNHDIFITGSDQVWSNSCIPFDPVYYLSFTSSEEILKCSYAASFGFSEMPIEMEDKYRTNLEGMYAYSVRESSAVRILKNLLGVDAVQSCDPTILLNAKQWHKVSTPLKRRRPYILIYSVNAKPELLTMAEELSKAKGMDVVYLPCIMQPKYMLGMEAHKFGFRLLSDASPSEWLGAFENAGYVLTDSFHGTVFSLINHKKFAVITKHQYGNNTRAQELLDVLGVSERAFHLNLNTIDDEIKWEDIDTRMQRMREDAYRYLKKITSVEE